MLLEKETELFIYLDNLLQTISYLYNLFDYLNFNVVYLIKITSKLKGIIKRDIKILN